MYKIDADINPDSRNSTSAVGKRLLLCLMSTAFCFSTGLRADDNALPVGASNFDPAGSVDVIVNNPANNPVMDINHNVDKTILNWESFNIGKNATVNFNQLNSSSLTLNRIHQLDPSQIFGALNANGRIFLINQNGILFGEGAQINVGELTASTLNMTDEVFDDGILSAIKQEEAAFALFTDAGGNPLPSESIVIENGAELNAAAGGRIMIIAPNIENNGIIRTPDGQTLLAAGQKVYLQASEDPNLRGLLVEVDSGGEVLNLGSIITERGNTTLIGKVINQNNRITATTSVSANGSIRLLARDTVNITNSAGDISIDATDTGEVNLGEASETLVLAEDQESIKDILGEETIIELFGEEGDTDVDAVLAKFDNPTAIDDQVQANSSVELMGQKIHLKENSLISAKGGEVSIRALENPLQEKTQTTASNPIPRSDDVVVQIEANSKIDVSGHSTTLEMSRNNVVVELRGNELKDLPLQRDGALRGETVVVDVRRADEFQLGDISGNLGTVERGVAERTSAGGTININSEGDVRFLTGAEIDVSGGQVNYKAGDIKTTVLDTGLGEVDIHEADPNVVYQGIKEIASYNEAAYADGADAGTVQIAGHGLIVDGTLKGNAVAGRYQRTEATRPQGGKLIIGLPDGSGLDVPDFRAPNIVLQELNLIESEGAYSIGLNESMTDAGLAAFEDKLLLSTDFLDAGGFNRAEFNSNGNISIKPADSSLVLAENAEFNLRAESINVNRSISSVSGDFDFSSTVVNDDVNSVSTAEEGLFIGDNVILDVSGNWTNDHPTVNNKQFPDSPLMLNGGSISLSANEINSKLSLGNNVALLTLGGAQRTQTNEIIYGRGGDISLSLGEQLIAIEVGQDTYMNGYGPAGGGSLEINANGISIEDMTFDEWSDGQSVAAGGTLIVPDFIFYDTGFSDFSLTSNQGNITVASGAEIEMKTSNLFLPISALTKKSGDLGTILANANTSVLLPSREEALSPFTGFKEAYQREPQSLTLAILDAPGAQRNDLVLESGSSIVADAGATIELINDTGGTIEIGGSIDAPAANIDINLSRQFDQIFDASHAIVLAEGSSIDVSGTVIDLPDPNPAFTRGRVYDAGNVNIRSSGYLIVEGGVTDPVSGELVTEAAKIDVSGISANLDVTGGVNSLVTKKTNISGDAGSIDMAAAEAIIIDGDLNLASSGQPNARGGSLSIELDRTIRGSTLPGQGFDISKGQEIIITQDSTRLLDQNFASGDAIDSSYDARINLFADTLMASGAEQLVLKNDEGEIRFGDEVTLNILRDIVLDAPVIETFNTDLTADSVNLTANYIALGSSELSIRSTQTAEAGDNTLNVNANLIDLLGVGTLQGTETLNLNSTGDIRFRGVSNQLAGDFAMQGIANLSADQIYPTTLTNYVFSAGSTGTINVNPGGEQGIVLSAGGSLTLEAADIHQNGVIKAPHGEIILNGSNSVVLNAGSTTSVSGDDQSILLGQTLNGTEWIYTTTGNIQNAQTLYSATTQNSPDKNIVLDSDNVDVEEGAVVDLSGGGDLVTWEFIPGPGGSKDFLRAENAGNFFAILPGLENGYAPFDAQEMAGWDIAVGETVFLDGAAGLAAGNYTVLPARYALLPGAYLIEAVDGFDHLPVGQIADIGNGTLVAGSISIGGTDIADSSTSGFIVRDGSYANQLSEFDVNNADDVVKSIAASNEFETPRLSVDAGTLTVNGGATVDLNGDLVASVEAGARGALVDINAGLISIVETKTGAGPAVELLASDLNQLNAESILVGGTREFTTEGTQVNVGADELTIDSSLSASEILLTANDTLTIKQNSQINATGNISNQEEILLLDDNAMLRVSAGSQADIKRSSATGAASLILENGATIASDNSIAIDSSDSVQLDATINVAEGGALHLGASSISIGDTATADGLLLDDTKLGEIQGLDLRLRSSSDIKFFGTAELDQSRVRFDATGFTADEPGIEDVAITADEIIFRNLTDNVPAALSNPANGELELTTNQMTMEEGVFTIQGFETVTANVKGTAIANDDATLDVQGDLNLSVAKIGADSGADFNIDSSGNVNIVEAIAAGDLSSGQTIGATLNISGENVLLDTLIDLPVGNVNLTASNGDVVLGGKANIDVSGETIDVIGLDTISLPGGNVNLLSEQGNVELQQGSNIDVTSGGEGSATGAVNLIATNGDVSVKGNLEGSFPENEAGEIELEKGGVLSIDAMTIGQSSNPASQHTFKDLNTTLQQGGFTGGLDVKLGQGDINIELGDAVLAQNIKLVADQGSINISGALLTVDDQQGGSISLIANDDLNLNPGAFLSVAPLNPTVAASETRGGDILLQATNGTLDMNTGTLINAGVAGGQFGTLHLRVPRVAANDEIKLADLNTIVQSVQEINIEGVKVFDGISNINNSVINTIKSDTDSFMTHAAAIENRLGVNGDDRFRVVAGAEVRNEGDIVLSQDLDLSEWRNDGEAGFLTIRATGDLNVNSDLVDGISTSTITTGGFFPQIIPVESLTERSWGLTLVAGADNTGGTFSADTLATGQSSADFNLANGKTLRSGSGDIQVAAARDINLGDDESVIYTLGSDSGFGLDRRREDADFSPFAPIDDQIPGKFIAENGGDITLIAGNDINGPGGVNDKTQLITEWYKRQAPVDEQGGFGGLAKAAEDAGAWVDYNNFKQGVGAFGGGDIDVSAGNNIVRLSLSTPTSISSDYDTQAVSRVGEGNLTVNAGGDIEGGIFFVGDGNANIVANGDIVSGRENLSGTAQMDTIIAMMGGNAEVTAGGDIGIDAIYNPTTVFNGSEPLYVSYGDTSRVGVKSLSGDISYDPGFTDIQENTSRNFSNTNGPFRILPGDAEFAAIQGNINFASGEVDLLPVNEGSLKLYANNNINVDSTIIMSDAQLSLIPTINNPVSNTSALNLMVGALQRSNPPLHLNDNDPSWIVSNEGDINGGVYFLPEAATLSAGRDVRDIRFSGQNLRETDITRIQAGRDIVLTDDTDVIGLSGPGRLEVIASRNIDLGPSVGIETRGNLLNGVLADQGADIIVQAGVGEGAQYLDFFQTYFLDAESALFESGPYHQDYLDFLNERFDSEAEVNNFLAQSAEQQWQEVADEFVPRLYAAFYSELSLAGSSDNPTFEPGFQAIDVLFPESDFNRRAAFDPEVITALLTGGHDFDNGPLNLPRLAAEGETDLVYEDVFTVDIKSQLSDIQNSGLDFDAKRDAYFQLLAEQSDYQGDLSLFFSKIYSLDGGDIDVVTPGGIVNVGLAAAPANAPEKAAGELGFVAQSFGDIRIHSVSNIDVNQSRISTLLGGDIVLWSSTGDVDAGRGSKTAISAPQPIITVTDTGEISVDLSNTITGSGIRGVTTDPNVPSGKVVIRVPNGTLDAGDAGIVADELDAVADDFANTDNIVAVNFVAPGGPTGGGDSISVAAVGGDAGAAASRTAEAAVQEENSDEEEAPIDEGPQLTYINVEVIGFGEEEDA